MNEEGGEGGVWKLCKVMRGWMWREGENELCRDQEMLGHREGDEWG